MTTQIDPHKKFPITMSNGDTWPQTIFLKNFIDHPNISIGDYTYYNDFRLPIDDIRKLLVPYMHPSAPENLSSENLCKSLTVYNSLQAALIIKWTDLAPILFRIWRTLDLKLSSKMA